MHANYPYALVRGGSCSGSVRFAGRLTRLLVIATSLVFTAIPPLLAQSATTGSITGRIQNAVTGDALEHAQIAVEGTSITTATDAGGYYLLDNLPAGETTLRITFAGLDAKNVTANVTAGQQSVVDARLTSVARYGANADLVKLDRYIVESTRETNASAIAVNEQRYAPNIKSIVSTDEFGAISDKNPGEFLKYLPGVDVEYFANNIIGVSVRGLGSVNTEISFDGMPTASANAETVGRGFEVQYASASDISRVEIRKLPLPEDSSNALGGSINLIRRSAFEYSSRKIEFEAFVTADGEKLTLQKIDGPKDELRQRWRPNWMVKWTEPLLRNKFGFAFTIGQNNVIANTHWSLPGWNLGSASNNTAAAAAIAAGQTYTLPSIYTPAERNPLNHNAPLMQGKDYASLRLDWRPQPELTMAYSIAATRGWKQVADDIRYRWDAAATGSGNVSTYNDPFTTIGRTGGGGIYHDNPLWRDISTPTVTNSAEARWHSGAWTVRAAGVASFSSYKYMDLSHGFFNSTSVANVSGLPNIGNVGVGANTANPVPITITFGNQTFWGPKTITAVASSNYTTNGNNYTAGQPVEWWKNSVTRIGGARSRPGDGENIVTAAKIYVRRDFSFRNPFSLQLGFDFADQFKNRHYPYYTWRFVGADGVYGTADDSATQIAADHLRSRNDSEYSYPGSDRISMSKLYALYQANPSWFQYDANRSSYLSLTSNPDYKLWETTKAPYLQFDTSWFHGRLRMTGGVRYEDSRARAYGLENNASAAYLKYADGTVVHVNDAIAAGPDGLFGTSDDLKAVANLGSSSNVNYVLTNGPSALPLYRAGAPIFSPAIQAAGNADRAAGLTSDSGTNLGRSTMTYMNSVYTRLGAYAEGGNSNYFPSLHVTLNLTDNLSWQIGYARTQAKNRFDRSVIPQNEIDDTIQSDGAIGQITIRNKNLKPWTADNFETRLSYYNATGGVIGLGVFRKNIQDYQLNLVSAPMTAEDIDALNASFPELGVGPQYIGYELSTWQNVGSARIDGAEIEMRQNLDTYVPHWARGFLVTGSANYTNLKGQPGGGDFNQLADTRFTLGVGFHRGRLSTNVGYIVSGRRVNNGSISSNGFTAEQIYLPDKTVDFNIAYGVTRTISVYFAGRNITDERRKRIADYAQLPKWARLDSSNTYGITYTFGITGAF